VSSDYSIQKLLEKELIIISGRNEEMPGKPLVYSTSRTFMDYFGINSAADLPKLKEIFAETLIEPTVIKHGTSEILPEAGEDGADGSDNPGDQSAEGTGTEGSAEPTLLIVGEDGQLIEHEETADSTAGQSGDQEEETPPMEEPSAGVEETTEEHREEEPAEDEATEEESNAAHQSSEDHQPEKDHQPDEDQDPADEDHPGNK